VDNPAGKVLVEMSRVQVRPFYTFILTDPDPVLDQHLFDMRLLWTLTRN